MGGRLRLPASSFHGRQQLLKQIRVQNSLRPVFPPRRQTLAWDSKCAPSCLGQIHLLGNKFTLQFPGLSDQRSGMGICTFTPAPGDPGGMWI